MATLEGQRQDDRRSVRLSPELDNRLTDFARAVGEKTKTRALARLLSAVGVEAESIGSEPAATYENVISQLAPVCIFGLAGSGKSSSLRNIVERAVDQGHSVILIDVANEHTIGKKQSALTALSRRFNKGLYRIVPERDPASRKATLDRLFQHLLTLASKGKLKNFLIAVDEAHELKESTAFTDFVIEARKFVFKVVICCADPTTFENISALMRPLPK